MKKSNILMLILICLSQKVYSQIYPLDYKEDVPNGAYYKDLNNELDQYVGLWKGNWNGKTVYLELKKVKMQMDNVFMDRILGERKIIDANGNIEIDRISNFDMDTPEFMGIGVNLKNTNIKRLNFYPKNMCGKMAVLDIINMKIPLLGQPSPTQMTLKFEYLPSIHDPNCEHNAYIDQHDDFPINFPKNITLIKQ